MTANEAAQVFEKLDALLKRKGYNDDDLELIYYECGCHSSLKGEFINIYGYYMNVRDKLAVRKGREERKRTIRKVFKKSYSITKCQKELEEEGIVVSKRYISRIVADIPRLDMQELKGAEKGRTKKEKESRTKTGGTKKSD